MDAARHQRIKEVFLAAQELAPAERAALLDQACAGDAALRKEVESLLAHDSGQPLIAERPRDTMPVATADPLQLVGLTLDGRYRIDALVAEGGFSYVYKGWHLRWERIVAVKVFKLLSADPQLKEAFIKEGALLGELSRRTTAIVQSFDVGMWLSPQGTSHLFTVIEWLDGCTLGDLLKRERSPWPLDRVLETLTPIADALAVAHERGIAHRDVKPGNIFLVDEGGRRTTKLLDFGVAKVAADYEEGFQGTGGRVAAFTLGYAAPEQLSKRHGSTGPWTDVYALALVTVELLAGRPARDEELIPALKRLSDPEARPTPGRLGVVVPAAVDAVFDRALAFEADQRHPDAAAFWRALVAAAQGGVAAAPPSAGRRWVIAGLALAGVLALAGWILAR